jgi:hypothetical protein
MAEAVLVVVRYQLQFWFCWLDQTLSKGDAWLVGIDWDLAGWECVGMAAPVLSTDWFVHGPELSQNGFFAIQFCQIEGRCMPHSSLT